MSRRRPDKHFNDCLQAMGDLPKRRTITGAALYEMFTRHSQCVLVQRDRCPLLVFTNQLAEEINEFFNGEE